MKYIAFLKGINKFRGRITGDDLVHLFQAVGLKQVRTIDKDGLIFVSDEAEAIITQRLEREIYFRYRIAVPVLLRTLTELEAVLTNMPFQKEPGNQMFEFNVYVTFLKYEPNQERLATLSTKPGEKYVVYSRQIYFFLDGPLFNSPLALALADFEVHALNKNWRDLKRALKQLQLLEA